MSSGYIELKIFDFILVYMKKNMYFVNSFYNETVDKKIFMFEIHIPKAPRFLHKKSKIT